MQFFELERQKVTLSFLGKSVTKRLDLLSCYRVIDCVDRHQPSILIKVSTKAFVSIEVTVSPIVLTCTFVSLVSPPVCTEVSIVAALW